MFIAAIFDTEILSSKLWNLFSRLTHISLSCHTRKFAFCYERRWHSGDLENNASTPRSHFCPTSMALSLEIKTISLWKETPLMWRRKSRPRVHPQPRELCIHRGRGRKESGCACKLAVPPTMNLCATILIAARAISRNQLCTPPQPGVSCVCRVCIRYWSGACNQLSASACRAALKDAHLWFIYKTEKYSPLPLGHMQSISSQHKETNTAYKSESALSAI